MQHVTAYAPFSTARRSSGIEITGFSDDSPVRLFTPDEYDELVWPLAAEVRDV